MTAKKKVIVIAKTSVDTQRNPGASAAPINLTAFVEKTVTNLNRKKLNLAVSNLKETGSDKGDAELFASLCSHFLDYVPHVVRSVRVGKPSTVTNIRLLIVTLNSATEVDDLLREAIRLRDAEDDYVRRRVFINRDLTKEESKALYEKRVARRTKALAEAAASAAAAAVVSAGATAAAGSASQVCSAPGLQQASAGGAQQHSAVPLPSPRTTQPTPHIASGGWFSSQTTESTHGAYGTDLSPGGSGGASGSSTSDAGGTMSGGAE